MSERVQYNGFYLDVPASVRAKKAVYFARVSAGAFSEVVREATEEDRKSRDFQLWLARNDSSKALPVATKA